MTTVILWRLGPSYGFSAGILQFITNPVMTCGKSAECKICEKITTTVPPTKCSRIPLLNARPPAAAIHVPLTDPPGPSTWLSKAHQLEETVIALWEDFSKQSPGPTDPCTRYEGLARIHGAMKAMADVIKEVLEEVRPSKPTTHTQPPLPHLQSTAIDTADLDATATLTVNPPLAKLAAPVQVVLHATRPTANAIPDLPDEIFCKVASALPPSDTDLLGVSCSRKGNLILIYTVGSSHTSVRASFHNVRAILGLTPEDKLVFDTPWSRVHLVNVMVWTSPEDPIPSSDQLQDTLSLNPAIKALQHTLCPSWLKKPNTNTGTHSSVVLTFEDSDGSLARSLPKTPLFAFGSPIRIRK
ncbi:hypothetical protein CTheo_7131 [Ceratobasidium theobromae]|uniref:Uncharacterized protein n=1 Tax=Ceratobasidium theobromae TaxID=1582974 RepID=A0A5N5QCC4_9AGAM|nr:hypothetical protein CTheo_7131 [Ceratobasidium theobromae]